MADRALAIRSSSTGYVVLMIWSFMYIINQVHVIYIYSGY